MHMHVFFCYVIRRCANGALLGFSQLTVLLSVVGYACVSVGVRDREHWLASAYTCIHVYKYIYIYVYIYIHLYICIYIYIYACVHART